MRRGVQNSAARRVLLQLVIGGVAVLAVIAGVAVVTVVAVVGRFLQLSYFSGSTSVEFMGCALRSVCLSEGLCQVRAAIIARKCLWF